MKLSQLRVLVAVTDCGNFSEAALRLEMSQSAVSHAIAALEEELGVVLFLRGRHGAMPTPAGARIADYARQIMQLQESIRREANLAKGLQGGQLRVASFRSVASNILPKVIARFRQNYPAINIRITEHDDSPDVEHSLRTGMADVGFVILPTSNEFEAWEILRDEYIVLLPPDFKQKGDSLSWQQLVDYPLIMPPESHSCCANIFSHCESSNHTLNVAYVVREDSTTVNMVAQGLGATIIPRLAAEPIPEGVHVRSLLDPLFRTIGVGVLTNALSPPSVYAFLDILKASN